MKTSILSGLLIPFLGTTLGAMTVFLRRRESERTNVLFTGFAAGVMTAATVFSLLLPAVDYSGAPKPWNLLPAVGGALAGGLFMSASDRLAGFFERKNRTERAANAALSFSVTLHNLPEGMAVGVIFSGCLAEGSPVPITAAIAFAVGIALQNIPEGAIISLTSPSAGKGKKGRLRAFTEGVLSGAVEPIAAGVTLLAAGISAALLPYLLGFAAGAMLFAVTEELCPEFKVGEHPYLGTAAFLCGFLLMMSLDLLFS